MRLQNALSLIIVSSFLLIGCGDSTTSTSSGGEGTTTDVTGEDTHSPGDAQGGGDLACTDEGDCNDDNPCTLDSCDEGVCTYFDSFAPGCDAQFGGAECKSDSDCAALVSESLECSIPRCNPDSNTCEVLAAEEGTPCDDGDACTSGDYCASGECTPEMTGEVLCEDGNACTLPVNCDPETGCPTPEFLVCQDDNPCTEESCDPNEGCIFAPVQDGTECDDGDSCSSGDLCEAGECVGSGGCADDNPCTVDACDEDGECTFTIDPALPCDDGDICTEEDLCGDDGACVGVAVVCDDGDACTTDSCDPEFGCVHLASEDGCDDGDPCNGIEVCTNDGCVSENVPVCGDGVTDGACGEECDDGGTEDGDGCSSTCTLEAVDCVSAEDCEDGNPCTDHFCTDGTCDFAFNTASCDDGNLCTTADTCSEGACVGTSESCDDGLDCTADSCDATSGCLNEPNNALCDDGDVCTNDTCAVGVGCVQAPETGTPCDDGNACTEEDSCTTTMGGSAICKGVNVPDCVESFPLCSLSGFAGQEVSCFIKLARATEESPGVAALQLDMYYSAAELTLQNIYGVLCPNPADPTLCFDVALMPSGTLGTGHTVSSQPNDPALCNGDVTFILSNLSNPFALVSEAFFSAGGALQGEPVLFEAKFTLNQDSMTGFDVEAGNIVASSQDAESVTVDIEDGIIVSKDLK